MPREPFRQPVRASTCYQQFAAFVRQYVLRILLISAAVLTPCFWHRNIAAGDLGSHVYNAWLAHLVERGQAPGLWLAQRWNNVLFDLLLDALGRFVSLHAAGENLRVARGLDFLLGSVRLRLCSHSARAVAPLPLHRHVQLRLFLPDGLSEFLYFAGPRVFRNRNFLAWTRLGAPHLRRAGAADYARASAWFRMAGRRLGIRRNSRSASPPLPDFSAGRRWAWLFLPRTIIFGTTISFRRNDRPFYFFNGTDQLLLFSSRYAIPEFALLIFIFWLRWARIFSAAPGESFAGTNSRCRCSSTSSSASGWSSCPKAFAFPQQPSVARALDRAPHLCLRRAALLPACGHCSRANGTCSHAALSPQSFSRSCIRISATINRMEAQAAQLVRTVRANSRILATIKPPFPGSRILIQHIADRACIGHCFSYGNYEPGFAQFRVHATPGNPYAMSDFRSHCRHGRRHLRSATRGFARLSALSMQRRRKTVVHPSPSSRRIERSPRPPSLQPIIAARLFAPELRARTPLLYSSTRILARTPGSPEETRCGFRELEFPAPTL